MQPIFAEIAGGNVTNTGTPGDKLQGSQGCICVDGGTGLIEVTISPPNNGLADADLIVLHNPGFATSKAGGGITTTMSSITNGVFFLESWDQSTVPPVPIDSTVHFIIKHKYNGS